MRVVKVSRRRGKIGCAARYCGGVKVHKKYCAGTKCPRNIFKKRLGKHKWGFMLSVKKVHKRFCKPQNKLLFGGIFPAVCSAFGRVIRGLSRLFGLGFGETDYALGVEYPHGNGRG